MRTITKVPFKLLPSFKNNLRYMYKSESFLYQQISYIFVMKLEVFVD